MISALEANTTIGWVFTDTTQEAIDGVYSGDYYAALIMPDDFTSDLVSFLSDDVQHPEIIYYENEKKNAIAPKITAKPRLRCSSRLMRLCQYFGGSVDHSSRYTDGYVRLTGNGSNECGFSGRRTD